MSDVLAALGGQSDVLITLDMETYYDKTYSLKKLTTEAYVRDSRFEVIGVGVKFGSAPAVWLTERDFRAWASVFDWSRVTVACHHAQFDGFILSHHYGIRPRFLLCTMSMGRALHGPSVSAALGSLAPLYNVGQKGDEILKTLGKRRKDFSPEEYRAFGEYCNNDVDLTYRLLQAMLRGFPPAELWLINLTVKAFTEPVLDADQAVLARALAEERRNKAELLQRVGADRESLSSSEKFAALLRSLGEEPPMKRNPKGEPIYAFAQSDAGMRALAEHPRDEVRFLTEARLAVKSTIVETRTERLIGIAERGPVPFYLKYCGAHTHRWSGGDKMNPQNFNRGGDLRASILAPPGHTLCVADSGQIEARVVAWLAGQTELLDTFRRNDATEDGDFYSDEGSRYFGRKLSKKETPVERQISKAMVLGLGFGMGWAKFAGELLKGMLGADPVQFTLADARRYGVSPTDFEARPWGNKGDTCGDVVRAMVTRLAYADLLVHCAVVDHFVDMYRQTNKKIAGLWRAMNEMLAVMESGTEPRRFGCLTFIRNGIVKPNGLTLHYPGLKRSAGGDYSYQKSPRERAELYGGLITENVVQSLARDVVAEQSLWICADGYPWKTMSHDEIVTVPRESEAETCLVGMLGRMKVAPVWAKGLPLNASGGFSRSYGDAK